MRMLGTLIALVALSIHGSSQADASKWKLTWSDEFNAADGTAPDPVKWSFDLGGEGWGNKETKAIPRGQRMCSRRVETSSLRR